MSHSQIIQFIIYLSIKCNKYIHFSTVEYKIPDSTQCDTETDSYCSYVILQIPIVALTATTSRHNIDLTITKW